MKKNLLFLSIIFGVTMFFSGSAHAVLPALYDTAFGPVQVTAGSDSQEPAIVRRVNGDLIAVFNASGGDKGSGLYSSISKDGGHTWLQPHFILNSWSASDLMENASGELFLLAISDVSGDGLVTLTSGDGISWENKKKVTPTSVNQGVGSIIQAKDGYYYVSFSPSTSPPPAHVYVTRSRDLTNWEVPVQTSEGDEAEIDSSLLQASDGTFYLAYNRYVKDQSNFSGVGHEIVIASSPDWKTWTIAHVVNTGGAGSAAMGINLKEISGRVALFYDVYSTFYYVYLSQGVWSQPKILVQNGVRTADTAILPSDLLGILYQNNSDIFFRSLDKLVFSPTIPSPSPAPKPVSKPAPAPVVKPAPTPPPTIEQKEEKAPEKVKPPENVSSEEQKPRGIFRRFIDSIKTIWHGLFSSAVRIDSISPAIGRADALVTIHGSGFTTQQEHDTRIKSVKDLPAGNYVRIAGAGTMGPPTVSSDGKTLKFQLALDNTQVPKNCVPGTIGPKCQISLQVVNGEGKPSNIVHFQLYPLSRPLAVFMSLDSQNPAAQNIAAGSKDIEVLRFKVKSSADNPVNFDITDFIVKTVPTRWEIYCKDFLSDIKITDASTGELVGLYSWSYEDGVIYCSSVVPTWLSISPGQEKTFSVKLSLAPQAKVGLQFRIAAYKAFNGVDAVIEGSDSYYDGISYAGVTSNLVTIE